jgi:hypothetical protein
MINRYAEADRKHLPPRGARRRCVTADPVCRTVLRTRYAGVEYIFDTWWYALPVWFGMFMHSSI